VPGVIMKPMAKQRAIRLLTAASLTWGAFFCFGMGMTMGSADPAMAANSEHSCCPSQAPEPDEGSGDNGCCAFVPAVVVTSPALPQNTGVMTVPFASPRLPAFSEAAVFAESRAPPGASQPGLSPCSPRAPPAI